MANIPEMVKFNADGLIPAVTQDIRTDEVLMVAYMNREAIEKTIETGLVHYYSRSRRRLWLKGESSGHYQKVRSISVDCDADTLLLKVEQTGAACHTGHHSCFFTKFDADELRPAAPGSTGGGIVGSRNMNGACTDENGAGVRMNGRRSGTGTCFDEAETANTVNAGNAVCNTCDADKAFAICAENKPDTVCGTDKNGGHEQQSAGYQQIPDGYGQKAGPEVLGAVFGTILDRLDHPKEGSYTNYLFTKGLDKILKKIGEEASEVVIAAKNGSTAEIQAEVADLIYHIMVLLAQQGMTLNDIYMELKKRA